MLLAALVAAAAATEPAAAETRPPYGGAIVGSLSSEPVSLDPVAAQTHAEVSIVSLVYDTLYRIGEDGRPVPHLAAAEPRWSVDRRQARIALVPGVHFHDGSALTTDDVVRSLRRTAAGNAGWLLVAVTGIAAEGSELVLTLRRPAPELPMLLAAPATAITPRGAAPAVDRPIGTGPFRVTAVDRPGRRLLLAAYEEHFAGRPYLDSVELRWYPGSGDEVRRYELGEVQLSLRGDVAFTGHRPKFPGKVVEGPATLLVYVGFGRAHPQVTGNRDLRRALSLSLSRNGFRSIGAGERMAPAITAAAVDIGGPTTDRDDREVRAAEAAAAMQRAVAGEPTIRAAAAGQVDLEILVDATRLDDREIAGKVSAALFRLGVRAHVTAVPATRFAARVDRGECDLYIGQMVPPVPVPELAVAAAGAAGGDQQWLGKVMRPALLRGPVTGAQAQAWFAERLPVLPLFHRSVRVHHRADIRGVDFDPVTRLSLTGMYLLRAGAK